MATCRICGKGFNLNNTRENFEKRYDGEIEYDYYYPNGDYCYRCAVNDTDSSINDGEDREYELETGRFYYDNKDKY